MHRIQQMLLCFLQKHKISHNTPGSSTWCFRVTWHMVWESWLYPFDRMPAANHSHKKLSFLHLQYLQQFPQSLFSDSFKCFNSFLHQLSLTISGWGWLTSISTSFTEVSHRIFPLSIITQVKSVHYIWLPSWVLSPSVESWRIVHFFCHHVISWLCVNSTLV